MDQAKAITFLNLFPFVENSVKLFDDQNRFLNKIVLTGKIAALEQAANLFTFTEKTILTFSNLKEELIPLLVRENLNRLTDELRSKAQTAIDILVRNLFERTADVGFLATDGVIVDFLRGNVTPEDMRARLVEYTLKYSVYDEILLLDPSGNVRMNIHPSNTPVVSSDAAIFEALRAPGYVERYEHTDLFPGRDKTLFFAHKIVDGSRPIGVLVLVFRFEDEMERIFGSILNTHEEIFFSDSTGNILIESRPQPQKKFLKGGDKNGFTYDKGRLLITTQAKGYEGYHGAGWNSTAALDMGKKMRENGGKALSHTRKSTLDDSIRAIIAKADDLIEDLSDVIINGELIASKERVYVLTPVLDNLRNISSSILSTIKESVTNLENTIMDGSIYEAESAAKLAVDIMDRNLYERANDCRWWALTPAFIDELAKPEPNRKTIESILKYINDLYTVYTNLFVFDARGVIIASSSNQDIVGRSVSSEALSRTASIVNTQGYYVSPFESTPYYNGKPTYIYYASLILNRKSLGGIGIVFDSEPQFKAMLDDSFPTSKRGFSCFAERNGTVLASNHPQIQPLEKLTLDEEILRFQQGQKTHRFVKFEDKEYLVGIALSKGYREYKTSDGYKNDVLSLTFIEY